MTGTHGEPQPGGAAGPSPAGSVLLDLGAGVGALVLYAPAALDGAEIEISPAGHPAGRRTHALVRGRAAGMRAQPGSHEAGPLVYAAVYPGLAAGRYTIWRDAVTPAGPADIVGGQVTTWHWPG